MTDGDAPALGPGDSSPASEPTLARNLPGQAAIVSVLAAQDEAPRRSRFARVFGVSPLGGEARVDYDAALSEIEVGGMLARLPEDWTVLHALPVGVGASEIDHIVIGPSGVFIITTTNHPGQAIWVSQRAFLVSGIRHPYIRNMEYEMGRAERLLSRAAHQPVEVSGILVVVAAKSLTVHDRHRDVSVLSAEALVEWLTGLPVVLCAEKVGTIGQAAALESTWHVSSTPTADRSTLRGRFEALRAEVRQAWRRQLVWATLATVVGGGGFVLVTFSILFNALAALSAD